MLNLPCEQTALGIKQHVSNKIRHIKTENMANKLERETLFAFDSLNVCSTSHKLEM